MTSTSPPPFKASNGDLEKPPLNRQPSISEPPSMNQPRPFIRKFLSTFVGVVIFVGTALMLVWTMNLRGNLVQIDRNTFFQRRGSGGVEMSEKGEVEESWKRWNVEKRSQVVEEEEYSTSTLKDGSTQTFVFTTRPIVNPGGYTIGTLTGYVPVSATTTSSESSITTTTTIPVTSSTKMPSIEPSRSTSSIPSSSEIDQESTSWHLVSITTIPPTSTPSPTTTTSSSSSFFDDVETIGTSSPSSTPSRRFSKRQILEFSFDQVVDMHLQHGRGLNFEEEDDNTLIVEEVSSSSSSSSPEEEKEKEVVSSETISPSPSNPSASVKQGQSGLEEFSTSTARKGGVYTLVKTTRPILNPAGYTIGTLDGAWVDVAKQTDRTTTTTDVVSTPTMTTTLIPTQSLTTKEVVGSEGSEETGERDGKRRRDELRKRDNNE